jgi:hypothetical protein
MTWLCNGHVAGRREDPQLPDAPIPVSSLLRQVHRSNCFDCDQYYSRNEMRLIITGTLVSVLYVKV